MNRALKHNINLNWLKLFFLPPLQLNYVHCWYFSCGSKILLKKPPRLPSIQHWNKKWSCAHQGPQRERGGGGGYEIDFEQSKHFLCPIFLPCYNQLLRGTKEGKNLTGRQSFVHFVVINVQRDCCHVPKRWQGRQEKPSHLVTKRGWCVLFRSHPGSSVWALCPS